MTFFRFLKIYDVGVYDSKFYKELIAPNQNSLQSGVWPHIQLFLAVGKLKFFLGGCEGVDPSDLKIPLAQIAQDIKAVISVEGKHTKH